MSKHLDTDTLKRMQEVGQRIGTNAVNDYLESHGLEAEDIEMTFFIKNKGLVDWKPKSFFIKVYEMELIRLMNKGALDVQKVGFLTILATRLDFQDNSLRNPDGSYMSQKDIIELTKLSKRQVISLIQVLTDDEIIFVKKQEEDKRLNRYFINPHLFFKGKKINKEVKEYFDRDK